MIFFRLTAVLFLAAVPLFLFTSCNTFAPTPRAGEMLDMPEAFSLFDTAAPVPNRWWEALESEELNGLIDTALADNLTIDQVFARLRQARMIARQSGAGLWPDLFVAGDGSIARRHVDIGEAGGGIEALDAKARALSSLLQSVAPDGGNGNPNQDVDDLAGLITGFRTAQSQLQALQTLFGDAPSTQSTITSESYELGLSSRYEVDLWGRIRARRNAAAIEHAATQEEVYAALLSLSGVVARQWLTAVAFQQQLALVQAQLELNRTTLELIELRYRKGMANALDVFQQRQVVAQSESLIPPLESGLAVSLNELAVLLGDYPTQRPELNTATLPSLGPLPEPGIPADLLASRPDVRASGLLLDAADWRVAAARADRLPSLVLSASASYGAEEWGLVFDNWLARLAGSVTGPIFDAGRRKAEVERTRAVVDERIAAYKLTVLDAVREVENALVRDVKQGEYISGLYRQLEAARATHGQALERYRKGLNDYLPVLSALTSLQVLERALVQAHLVRLSDRVDLHIALGGAWMREVEFEE